MGLIDNLDNCQVCVKDFESSTHFVDHVKSVHKKKFQLKEARSQEEAENDNSDEKPTDDNQEKNESIKPLEDSESDVEIDPTVDDHEKNESTKPLEDSEIIKTHTIDDCQEIQTDASSLYEEVILGLMKWDSRNGGPESRLVQNIEKFNEKDLGKLFSRTSAQFAGKFVEFAVLAGGDSLRKFENFIKGAEYKRILKERILEVEVEEEPTETEPAVSIEALPLNSRILKKKFCHFFNNSFCKKRDMCKFRHENSPRCKLVDIGLCAKWRCQFKHGAHLST
jgi:hypothetical protein